MARVLKFVPNIKELRIHLCPRSDSSKGVREFVQKSYAALKKENPNSPILVRECSGIQPMIWARYEFGRESCRDVANSSPEDVINKIGSLNNAK